MSLNEKSRYDEYHGRIHVKKEEEVKEHPQPLP
jgi:hypothetical protein